MSSFLKTLTALLCLGLYGLASQATAASKNFYVACWAHQSDKNRVMWTAPFEALNTYIEFDSIKEQFMVYIKDSGYVSDMSVVKGSCIFDNNAKKVAKELEKIKNSFNYSTDIGVNFVHVTWYDRKAVELYDVDCNIHNKANACFHYGNTFDRGTKGVKKNDVQAAGYYGKSCDMGNTEGCFFLGAMRVEGRGGPIDIPESIRLYDKACKGQVGGACYNMAIALTGGKGITKDVPRGLAAYEAGCTMNHGGSCGNLGWHYHTGTAVAADLAKAEKLYTDGCTYGSQMACNNLKSIQAEKPAT